MFWVKAHRWLAIVLVTLLVVWSVTGLLFHIKPGWDRAYDQLSVERRDTQLRMEEMTGLQSLGGAPITRIELFDTAIGPLYRARTATGTELFDARTGRLRVLDANDVRTPDTDRIDWLYRIHYLQWTGNRSVDRWLAVAGLALIWAVMIPGIVLFVSRLRRR